MFLPLFINNASAAPSICQDFVSHTRVTLGCFGILSNWHLNSFDLSWDVIGRTYMKGARVALVSHFSETSSWLSPLLCFLHLIDASLSLPLAVILLWASTSGRISLYGHFSACSSAAPHIFSGSWTIYPVWLARLLFLTSSKKERETCRVHQLAFALLL